MSIRFYEDPPSGVLDTALGPVATAGGGAIECPLHGRGRMVEVGVNDKILEIAKNVQARTTKDPPIYDRVMVYRPG